MLWLTRIFLLGYFCSPTLGANILMFHTLASYSHKVSMFPLADALVSAGHNVTYMSPIQRMSNQNPKVEDIFVPSLEVFNNAVIAEDFNIINRIEKSTPQIYDIIMPIEFGACRTIINSSEFKNWLAKGPKVDLVIQDLLGDCGAGIAHILGAKVIVYDTIPFNSKFNGMFGLGDESGTTEGVTLDVPYPDVTPSFWQRLDGVIFTLMSDLRTYQHALEFEEIFKSGFGLDTFPSSYDLYQNISLVFMTGNAISEQPRALPPMFVNVPALHVEESNKDVKLPKDLETFINSKNTDGSPNEGFVYISLGTVVVVSELPEDIRQAFWKTIEAFPKIRFLWRWSGDFPEKTPANLYLSKWFPQQQLLSHSKILGFVTQAGRPSLQEALTRGVPMITFPVLGDQDFNALRLHQLGAGVRLEVTTVKANELTEAVSKVVYDKSFRKRAKEVGSLFQDLPMKPKDTAVWWVEYVLRHDDLTHLKPMARNQTWYQRRMLDVWFTIFSVVALLSFGVLFLTFSVVKYLLRSNLVSHSNVGNSKKFKSS